MIKNKNKVMIIGIVILMCLMITGVSFALWQLTLQQNSTNIVTTGCFQIEFQDENEINLQNTYPISDEDGHELTPYEFTITNTCDTYASYKVNLEELEMDSKRLSNEYIKIEIENKISNLKDLEEGASTISNSDISHRLTEGVLDPNEEKTFELRLWMDESTPAIDEVMNASFESKVTVTSTYQNTIIVPYLDNIKSSSIPIKEDKYEFESYECNNNITLNWDNESWNYTLENNNTNSTQNVCNLYFKTINYEVVLYSETATFENNKVLTNLIKNGSFENDFDNWESPDFENGLGTISNIKTKSGNKSVYINDKKTNSAFWLFQVFTKQPNINDVIYSGISATLLTNIDEFYFSIITYESLNVHKAIETLMLQSDSKNYERYSIYYTGKVEGNLGLQIGSSNAYIATGYIDDVYVINLTDTFGSGLEPTQEWVDKYIPYFDTTANIAVESIEKLETKNFQFILENVINVECTNANYKIEENTLEISNATGDVYCKLS